MLPKNKKLPNKPKGPTKLGGRPVVKKGNNPPKKHNPPKGKGGNNKPAKKGGGGAFFGGLGGYKGVRKGQVSRLTNGLMREEMNGLNRQAREIKRDANEQINIARTDYERGKGDLNYVHGETDDYISSLAQKNQLNNQQVLGQQQAAQQALQSMLGSTYSGAQTSAQNELARLGISGGGNFQQLSADQANAQGVAAQSGANTNSTLDMAGQNASSAMQMLQGMNQGSMMQGLGQALNAKNDSLAETQNNRIGQLNEVRTAMQEANATRKDLFLQLLMQLQQTGWDQYVQKRELGMQGRQLNMQNRDSNRQFRLQKKALKKS
jgi:hypothetical protein